MTKRKNEEKENTTNSSASELQTDQKESKVMDAHSKDGSIIRIEQVIAVGLVGNKNFFQEKVIKEGNFDILKIIGFANEHVTIKKEQNQRSTTYIKGAFEGTNLLTGEKYMSGQLILPDSASGFVCAKLDEKGPSSIELTLRLERAEKSVVGYKFAALLSKLQPKNEPIPPIDNATGA